MVCRLVDRKFSQTVSFIYFVEKWRISGMAIVWNQHYETNRMKYELYFLCAYIQWLLGWFQPLLLMNEVQFIGMMNNNKTKYQT